MRCARWLRKRDHAGRVLALNNQHPGLPDEVGLTSAQVHRAVCMVDRHGDKLVGAAAINGALRQLGVCGAC